MENNVEDNENCNQGIFNEWKTDTLIYNINGKKTKWHFVKSEMQRNQITIEVKMRKKIRKFTVSNIVELSIENSV